MGKLKSVLDRTLLKRLLKQGLIPSLLLDRTYKDSFDVAGHYRIKGEAVQKILVRDYLLLHADELGIDRTKIVTKGQWCLIIRKYEVSKRVDLIDDLIEFYREILKWYKSSDVYNVSDTFWYLMNNKLELTYPEWTYARLVDYDRNLTSWITSDMYRVTSVDIPVANITGHFDYDIHGVSKEVMNRIVIESLLYDRFGLLNNVHDVARKMNISTIVIDTIRYLYTCNRSSYILYSILYNEAISDKHHEYFDIEALEEISIKYNELPNGIIEDDAVLGRIYTYEFSADRSNDSKEYKYIKDVYIPLSSKNYAYIVKHETHSPDHIYEVLGLAIAANKNKAKIINTYEGRSYEITINIDGNTLKHYGRLRKANSLISWPDVVFCRCIFDGQYHLIPKNEEFLTNNRYIIAVDDEHNGSNVYEKAAIVYDTKLSLIIDVIVLTNSKARVNNMAPIVIPDGRDCHRFVVSNVGQDPTVLDQFKAFINKYPNAIIVHYGGTEGEDPLYNGHIIIDVMKVYAGYNRHKWAKLRDAYTNTYGADDATFKPLYHRAFEDCIATIMIALTLPLYDRMTYSTYKYSRWHCGRLYNPNPGDITVTTYRGRTIIWNELFMLPDPL